MLTAASLADWAAVAQAVAAAGGLGFVAYALLKQESAERASVYQGISEQVTETDRIFLDYPELRPYFYDKKKPPKGTEEAARAAAAAEMIFDLWENVAQQSHRFDDQLLESWLAYFRDMYDNSPVLAEYWDRCGHWYSDELVNALDRSRKD